MKFNYNCLPFHFFLRQLFIISCQLYVLYLKLIEEKFNDDLYDVLVALLRQNCYDSYDRKSIFNTESALQ